MFAVVLYLVIFFLLIYYLYTRNYYHWKKKGVPYEKPFFIFGNFYTVATRKEHLFNKFISLYKTHKTPYFGIFIFNKPYLVVKDPEIVKKILVKDFDKFLNRDFASGKYDPVSSNSLFLTKDTLWKNLRSKISPVFTSGKMKQMLPLMLECARDMRERLAKYEKLDITDLTKRYSVDIISSCAFGINSFCLKSDSDSEILVQSRKLLDFKNKLRAFSVFCFFFVPQLVNVLRLTFADKSATDYLLEIFKSTLKEREKKNVVRNDLIDLLSNMKKAETLNDEYKFDDMKMASQAITFFNAGNETTSLIISYTLYELALAQDVQDRLRQELEEIFERDREFNYEGILTAKYLDMVLNETLRKYPLTTFLNRETKQDYLIEETGLKLEKNTPVLIPVAGLHYDPEFFPNPEKYDPERFNDENKINIKPYTFLPFGDGPRNCIGQRFGILVSKTALATLVKDFTFEPTVDTQIPLIMDPPAIFLKCKDGITLKVRKL